MLSMSFKNMFYGRNISRLFDLKGSLRGRFTQTGVPQGQVASKPSSSEARYKSRRQERILRRNTNDVFSDDESDEDTNSYYSSSTSSSGIVNDSSDDEPSNIRLRRNQANENISSASGGIANEATSMSTYLDGDFIEFTSGHPLPLNDRAKAIFHMSILNVRIPI